MRACRSPRARSFATPDWHTGRTARLVFEWVSLFLPNEVLGAPRRARGRRRGRGVSSGQYHDPNAELWRNMTILHSAATAYHVNPVNASEVGSQAGLSS